MNWTRIQDEIILKPVRSSGPGGQHVNKVSTKIMLRFNIPDSEGLSEEEKQTLYTVLKSRLSNDSVLQLQCEASRSQLRNKETAVKQLKDLLEKSLKKPKKRKPTRPKKSAVEKRLKSKKIRAEKKRNRKGPLED